MVSCVIREFDPGVFQAVSRCTCSVIQQVLMEPECSGLGQLEPQAGDGYGWPGSVLSISYRPATCNDWLV